MAPEGWTQHRLGELLDFKNGVNTDAVNYGAGTKFVNVMDVFGGTAITQRSIRGSVQVTDRQRAEYALQRGDVLFNRTSETREEIAYASVYLDDLPAVFGGFVIRGRPKGGHLDPDFSRYCFMQPAVRREFVRRCQGAIRANIGQQDMSEVEMCLPPLAEQRRIADALGAWDRAIEKLTALIETGQREKRALLRRLLTPAATMSSPKSAWRRMPFGEVATLGRKRYDPTTASTNPGCVELEHLESDTGRLLGTCAARGQDSLKAVFEPGDVLFGKLRPYLKKFHFADFAGVCSTEIWVLKAKPTVCEPAYLSYLVQTDAFQRAVNVSSGSKMPRADWRIVTDSLFDLPPLGEQIALVNMLSTADRLSAGYHEQRARLQRERAALIQQLLTGKLRVRATESSHA